METTNAESQPDAVPRQSANKWQQSTKDMWRRSTQAWHDSKDRYHQATVEAWHRSSDSLSNSRNQYEQTSADAWRRSSNSISNSKERCQQSTADVWQRSTNSWKNSKARCRQSTADMLSRSAVKLYQSTDRLQRLPHTQNKSIEGPAQEPRPSGTNASLLSSLHQQATSLPDGPSSQQTQPNKPPTVSESPQNSQPPEYATLPGSSQASQSSESPTSSTSSQPVSAASETSTEAVTPVAPKYRTIDPLSKEHKQDKQIRDLLNMTDQIFFRLHQAKELQKSKNGLLGEIEYRWINSTINEARRTGQDLVKLVEPHRLDMLKHKGKISSSNKKLWKLEDGPKAAREQYKLFRHQERLDKVFDHLKNISAPEEEAPRSNPTPQESQEHNEFIAEPIAELGDAPAIIAELTGDTDTPKPVAELTGDVEFTPDPVELPSDPRPETIIAELPGDLTQATVPLPVDGSPKSVPKIIITRTPENISVEYLGSPATPDQPSHENNEMNEILGWKQTRNDVRLHQSASLSNIIAEMDNARIN